MSITREDAAHPLRDAHEAEQRSRLLHGYQSAAPHLILWGCVYAATYTVSYFEPTRSGLAWLIIMPLAIAGDVAIAWRKRTAQTDWIMVPVMIVAFLAFIIATAAIMRPHAPGQTAAFVPLAVAWAYVVLGIHLGWRITFAGVALGVLTVFGYFALHDWFMLWMAAVGGGTLLLSGLWLRRA